MEEMSVPILLALSDIWTMALSAYWAAAAVSPPRPCSSVAEKLVTCFM